MHRWIREATRWVHTPSPANRAAPVRLDRVRSIELVLALLVVAGLTYFGFTAVGGDEFPLNVAVATLAFVVAAGLVLRMTGSGPR